MNPFYRKSLLAASLLFLSAPFLFAIDYDKEGQKPSHAKSVQTNAVKLAAEAVKSEAEDSKEITYAQILERPDDPELNYAYSKTQVRKGDLKGAAGTLERMLMVNPGLHNIRLFYAVVLFRLDNVVEAQRELEGLKKANPPEAVKNEAEIYLKVIKKRQKRTQASGSLSAGVEYDSNRNASPSSQTRLFMDTPLQLSGDSRKRKDSAYLMTGTAEVRRAVGARGKHEVAGSATYYGADQTHVRTVNLRAWAFRLNGTYKAPFAEITPGLIYDRVTLAGRHFLKNTGASLRLDRKLNKKTDALLETKYVYQDNVATPNVSSNPERRGGLYSVSAGVGRILTPVMKLNMDIGVSYKRAKKTYNSFDGFSLGLRHAWLLGRGMFLLSSVSAEWDEYSQADTILSATTRSDDILRGGLLYGIPVSTLHSRLKNLKDLTLTVNCEQLRSKSSVLNYTYINNKAALMLTYRWEMGI
jgi:hypothetical protein